MKQILLIVAVLAYLCLSNHISLYDAFVESSEPTDEAPSSESLAASSASGDFFQDDLQYQAWPKCRSPWSK